MRRRLLRWFVAALVPLATSCSRLPTDLQFASEFVDVLRRDGITVKGVYRWSHHPFKFDVSRAATIWTGLGSVQLVVFEDPAPATPIEVIDRSEAELAPAHRYLIANWPDQGTVVWETNYSEYFTSSGKWLIVTHELELNRRIKRALENDRPVGTAFSCEPSPTQDLLPGVVGPMTGSSPAWMVDDPTWPGEDEPAKTLWVLRRTSDLVRISGRRLDARGRARLRRGSDKPSDTLFVANPSAESVIPGGAPPTVMRSYVFLPSHVFYPSAGCWQFTVQIAQEEFRIVREFRVDGHVR